MGCFQSLSICSRNQPTLSNQQGSRANRHKQTDPFALEHLEAQLEAKLAERELADAELRKQEVDAAVRKLQTEHQIQLEVAEQRHTEELEAWARTVKKRREQEQVSTRNCLPLPSRSRFKSHRNKRVPIKSSRGRVKATPHQLAATMRPSKSPAPTRPALASKPTPENSEIIKRRDFITVEQLKIFYG